MEKRVVFRSAWLPYALLAPQIAVTLVFFFWPAAQAGWYSFQLQDAFGLRTEFVGLSNFAALFRDANYLYSFKVTALFSALVAVSGIAIALLLAVMADRVVRGALDAVGHHREQQRSEEHTSELQSPCNLVCRLLLEKKKTT